MFKYDVSVIIPVYNTEKYVADAINSVLDQSLDNVEVIVVDDGSTDGSLQVLKGFGNKIRLISKKNEGQGAARNDALRIANGEFVYFMDSDDLIERDTLKKCVDRCRRDNLDFVFFDAISFGDGVEIDSSQTWYDYHRAAYYQEVNDGCSVALDMLRRGIYRCSVCMSLFRRQFLIENGIEFPVGIIHEDEYFSAMAYANASRVCGIPEEFYRRRVRGNSVMTSSFSERNLEGYLKTLELMEPLSTTRQRKKLVRELSKAFVHSVMYNSWNLPLASRIRAARRIVARYPYALKLRPFVSMLFKRSVQSLLPSGRSSSGA